MTNKAVLAYANKIRAAELTTGTGNWDSSRPLENLELPQIPVPYVLATPDTGNLAITWQPDTPTTVDALAILGHTLPPGAVVTWKDEADQVLATVTWQPLAHRSRAPNLVAVLPAPTLVEELKIEVADAGSEPIRIGGLWASEALFFQADRGADWQINDYSLAGQVEATIWTNRRTIADTVSCTASRILDDQAWGTENGRNFKGAFEEIGTSAPVIYLRRATDQADIDRWNVYGQLERPRVSHLRGPLNRVQFGVQEMR